MKTGRGTIGSLAMAAPIGRRERPRGPSGALPSGSRLAGCAAMAIIAAVLAGCTATTASNKLGVTASPRVVPVGAPVPSGGGTYKLGQPYRIAGKTFVPREDPGYDEIGLASWYGGDFHGRRTANGEIFDSTALSAAHPTLPLPTYARVTNLENGKSVVVRINDRGPFAHNRLIDLSKRTAEVLEFKHTGTAKVRVQYVGAAPLDGNDGQWLTTTVRYDGQPVAPVMLATAPQVPAQVPVQPSVPTPAQAPAQVAALDGGAEAPQGLAPVPQMGFTQPTPAAFGTAPASPTPTPQVPVGGNVTYRWVSGYTSPPVASSEIFGAFAAFDDGRDIVLVISSLPLAPEPLPQR
ncbi:rare lipoprotein A [Tepidamorphus gemmatus]|uniref:Endolytic peptidoglycan transglycosylase RlpA n=2 Tax=Tepidamorphus gemmatus TaxID=747076 RepID=A0A4R3MGN4_9HYPH|nr:rare lipoprotein A [Tepidamorphus gemmatus]